MARQSDRDYAAARERPKPKEQGRAGFYGEAGHGDPSPPGGTHPGGGPENPARLHHDDYADYPLDPRTHAPTRDAGSFEAQATAPRPAAKGTERSHPGDVDRHPAEPDPARRADIQNMRSDRMASSDIRTMDDLFVHTLQDIYYAEKQIEKALPKMIEKASAGGLREGFEKHLEETHGHVKRLEKVFEMHGQSPKGVTCPAIDGIIKESDEIAGEVDDQEVLDAALAAAAQAVEHYEITRYGTLTAWARERGRPAGAVTPAETLAEEKAADAKLTYRAPGRNNRTAA
jgi:ferritin-like metal-binding protein YciE